MASTIAEEKKALRQAISLQIAALSPAQMQGSDRALFARFLALPEVVAAKTIFAFWGVAGREMETQWLVETLHQQGKTVGLPRMLPQRGMQVRRYDPSIPMVAAVFGIWEPSEQCELLEMDAIDLTLVPAVCYDRQGYRLGFGGGYYDRWLEHFTGVRIGLCRGALLQEQVPIEPHDTQVQLLVTEDGCLSISTQEKSGA